MSDAQERLTVSAIGGKAPLSVSITGPARVLAKIEKCHHSKGWFGRGGNGLQVDWGDGISDLAPGQPGSSCAAEQRTHVYAAPGTYHIRIEEFHPGPNDKAVTDWNGEATIQVKAR